MTNPYLDLAPAAAPAAASPAPAGQNPYLSLPDNSQQRLRTSVFAAGQANPDTAARARKIAERTGMAPDAVERNLPTAERQVLVEDIDSYTDGMPSLRSAYSDPYFAKVAKDDLFNLTAVHGAVKRLMDPKADDRKKTREAIGEVGSFLAEGAKQLGMGATVGVGAGIQDTAGFTLDVLGGVFNSAQLRDAATVYRGYATRARESMAYFSKKYEGNVAQGFMSGMQSAGTSLAALPLGIEYGANALAGTMATMVGAQSFNKARNKGQDVFDSALYAAPDAVFEFAFEKVPASRLLADIAKHSSLATMISRQLVPEIAGEQATTILQDLNEWVRLNPQKTVRQFIEERPDAAVQTLVATLVGVGVQAGTVRGVQRVLNSAAEQEARVRDAEVHANNLTDLLNAAMGSKLRERDPQTFAAFAQAAADEAGSPLAQVHVDATILAEVLKQSNVDLAAFAQMSPTAAEALQDAIQMGGSVAIPIGDLLGKMGDTGIEAALLPHLRASEDALSQEEAKAEQQAAQTLLQQNSAAIVQQAADSQAVEQSVEKVREVMFAQLQAAGRFSADVNRAYATMVGSFYTVLANDMGVTPEQAYAAYPLRVQGVGQQSADDMDQNATAFNTWFEGSKVVDDAGAPLRVYTGTSKDADFKKFNTPGNGVWFTADPEEASAYAKDNDSRGYKREGGRMREVNTSDRVLPVYLNLKNPMVYDVLPDRLRLAENYKKVQREVFAELKAQGYDGVIIGQPGTARTYVAFNATQIKSAIGNDGTYDVNDPSILSQSGRPTFYEDIPNERWLQGKIDYAISKGRNEFGVPHMSTVTGSFSGPVSVSLRVLSKLKGQRNEQNSVREESLQYIRDNWEEVSKNPPYVEVAYNGEAWISEGNHRIMVAQEKGLESMPVEIRYFDGGQLRNGPLSPSRIPSLDQSAADFAQSARAEGDTRYRDRAIELLNGLKIPARSAVAIMDGSKRVPLLPTNFDIARYFTRTDVLDISKAPGQKAMVEALYADTLKALTDAGSAVGWYDRKVTAALSIIAEEHPEILTDEQAKFGFITMLAITSNSTKVNENFEKAEALYRQWKTTGEWPVDVPDAKAADAMREGLQTMKDLVAEHGWQKVRDFMVGDHPRADIEAFSGGKIASELADSTVYGAVFLGSKIGAFFNNLYGNFTPVTMDRWFMRTANRVRGEMLALPESFPEMLGKLSEQIRAGLDDTYGQDPQDLLREIEAYVASGETGVEKTLRALPTVLAYSKARFNVYARGITDSNGKKRSFVPRTRENVLAKGLYEALTLDEQTPNGGGDRVLLRKVMHMLQSKLATAGIPIEMADLQAVLWYYEKDLFAKLKGEKAQANLFDGATEEAEDYETAARRTIDRLRGTWAGDAGPGRPAKRPAARKLVAVDPTLDLFAQGAPGEGGGGYSSGGTAPLEGAPNIQGATGPDPRLVAVAEKYAASRGITLRRQAVYVEADPERGARIAQAYADMKHAPGDPEVAEAYASMIEQTRAQYDALIEAGYSFTFFDSNSDPYGGNPWNAMRDLRANQHMAVYGTYDGYGTRAELNIGLAMPGGGVLDAQTALAAVRAAGGDVDESSVQQSDTEQTLVVRLKQKLPSAELAALSATLGQDAIAQRFADGSGELQGPNAAAWGSFNPEFFVTLDGQRASQVDNPMLVPTGLQWPDQAGVLHDVTANDLFRAVHDAFGHGLEGAGFRAQGEENAWQAHVRLFRWPGVQAITSETRGQNSWLNFGPYGETNRTAGLENTVFADQKTGLMPMWTLTEGRAPDLIGANEIAERLTQRKLRQAVDLQLLQQKPSEGADALTQDGITKPGEVQLTGVHFSTQQGLQYLNGQYYGKGLKGLERERVYNSTDTRLASRTYFYVDEGKGVRPEAGVGGNAHEAQLKNLYDINADPLKLIVGGDTNATESNILNAGFDGYYVRNAFNQQGAAVVIGQASRAIPVTPIANPTTAAPPLPAAPQVYKRGLMASELNKIDIDAIKTVAPSARLSAGTFQVLESEREAAAAMAATQGVELPVRYSQGKGTRGTYSPKSLTITLLENADLSTFLHETGHFMLEAMASVANTADAPVRVREDMAILLSWFGVKDLQTWLAMDTNGKRPYHEKFAESFEQYLFEGKAPSKELQPLFQRFTAWFERVYQSLTQFMSSHNTKLTDEVRAVFDRMLATKEQIAQKQEEMAYSAMFTARPDGMTDDQYVEWMMANQMATGTAEDELRARSLRDLRWVLNARARELVKLRKGVAEKRKTIEDEVRAEVAKQPVYAVQRWIKTGVLPDGTQQTGARLNTEDLRAIFGESPAAPWRYLATNLISASREDSLHPDVIAEMFGFTSGDQMVREIVGAYPEAQTIEGMTDNRVLERHGDIASQRAMDDAANEAVHNEYRAKVLASELKAMTQATQPVRLMLSAAKSFANQLIGRRKVKDIKPFEHERAEERAAKRGATATAKGELAEATAAKRDQVLQFHAAKAAREALAEVKQARELFEKIVRGKSDDIVGKTRDMDLVNATRAILANYGFGGKAKSAHDYLMVLKDHDPAMFDTIYDRVIMAEQSGKPFNELTMDELRALVDEVKSFWLLAKRTKQIEIDGKLVDLEEAQNALAERIDTLGIPLRAPGEGQAVTPAEKRLNMLQSFIAAATRVESWITAKDGGPTGVFRKYVFNTIKDAADAYRADRADYATRYTKLLATVGDTLTRGVIAAPELNYTFGKGQGGVGMSELLHAILHTGNESNKRKLLLGRKWAAEKPDGTLDTTKWDDFIQRMIDEGKLQKKHFDFAQGVWDMLESTKAQAQKMHRDVFGRYFAEVTADGFTNQFGNYRGGYVPAMADPGIVSDAKTRALAEEENQSLAFAFPTTNKGFTKARVEYNRPLMLDLRTLSGHLDKVLMFSHLEGPVRDVRRLLTGKGVAYALNRQDPVAFDSILTPWLNRTARQIVETPVVGDAGLMRFFSAARNNAGMAAMFANVTNAAQQITGFSIAATQVPPRLLMSAMASYLASPGNVKKTVKDSSPYMAGRMDNEVAAMHDAMRDILLDPNVYDKAKAWSRKHAYFLQAGVDNVITPMVWLAAYNHALEQKMDTKEARRHADSVVRTTQGSTLPEDVSRIETGNAFVRMFTQFMGYFNMQANLLGSGFVNISRDMGLRNGAGKALGLLFLGALAPAWVAEAIAQGMKGGPGDEDDDGWYLDDWIKAVFGYGTIRTATAMVPVAGQIINAAVNATNSKPYDDRIGSTPAISMIESTVRSPISVYKALVEDGSPQKAVRDVATAFSMATGIPVSGVARPLGYLAGMEADDIDPTSGADLVRGLLTGTASPESKE